MRLSQVAPNQALALLGKGHLEESTGLFPFGVRVRHIARPSTQEMAPFTRFRIHSAIPIAMQTAAVAPRNSAPCWSS
jgi:hypothetical protein